MLLVGWAALAGCGWRWSALAGWLCVLRGVGVCECEVMMRGGRCWVRGIACGGGFFAFFVGGLAFELVG